ncbi:MAG TPA: immunoglobulin domain-containing protein [Opitutaceae bacterium]|nr:immunoglobulin domain-containing protein [Opitutaceae bacterium]
MKTLLLIAAFLFCGLFASAANFHPIVVSDLTAVPAPRLTDSQGNTYSFSFSDIIRTSPQGAQETIYTSLGIVRYPSGIGSYHFTSIAVGADDTLYIVASATYTSTSVGAVLIVGKPKEGYASLDFRIINFKDVPQSEVGVDDYGNVYAIAPDGSILKVNPPTQNSVGSYTEIVPSYIFQAPDGSRVLPHNLQVSHDGRIFVQGYLPPYSQVRWLEIAPGPAAPTITQQPQSVALSYGESATLAVEAYSDIPVSYQWLLFQQPIPGATNRTLVTSQTGAYRVLVTNAAGQTASENAFVRQAGLINVSSRAAVGGGDDLAIAGFIISGDSGSPRRVLVRAVGPGLSDFGIKGFLQKPELAVYDGQGKLIESNTGWANAEYISAATAEAHAFPFKTDSVTGTGSDPRGCPESGILI